METIKIQVPIFKNKIVNLKNYTDEVCKDYIEILTELQTLLEEKKSVIVNEKLKKRINSCLKAVKIEINDRFDPYFFIIHDRKKQTEFTYSKTIILDLLKRIMKCF